MGMTKILAFLDDRGKPPLNETPSIVVLRKKMSMMIQLQPIIQHKELHSALEIS
jgi:hypothetical protein